VPATERLGNAAAERGGDRGGLGAGENGAVDVDRLPPGQPAGQGRHAGKFGQLIRRAWPARRAMCPVGMPSSDKRALVTMTADTVTRVRAAY
jgi:hypothetical protein